MRTRLAGTWKTIAVEQQGHGRTADRDRPLTFDQMAEDTAELLRQLGIPSADFFGFSDGGILALRIAIRYPKLVRRLVVLGANYNNDGLVPGVVEGFATLKPDDAAEFRDAYAKVAPDPKHLPTLVAKVMRQAVEMFRLRPRAQLAVLPGTTHFAPIERAHLVAALTSAFLEAPVSAEPQKPSAFSGTYSASRRPRSS